MLFVVTIVSQTLPLTVSNPEKAFLILPSGIMSDRSQLFTTNVLSKVVAFMSDSL